MQSFISSPEDATNLYPTRPATQSKQVTKHQSKNGALKDANLCFQGPQPHERSRDWRARRRQSRGAATDSASRTSHAHVGKRKGPRDRNSETIRKEESQIKGACDLHAPVLCHDRRRLAAGPVSRYPGSATAE